MRITIFLTALLLPWAAYDQNLFCRRGRTYSLNYAICDPLREPKESKRQLRLHSNVVPPWLRGAKPRLRMKVNHFSGKSRDVRDSNQRMIRRKFTNM